ncbi:Transmembrane transcriptional regulator (anti-sigma factor RsiW) [Modicisalibacter muralis]|uniref:Transmembrane transcriptional regulator (Anti-sigma factor RsiW) n=1 Tax=Modicisalibacter muralis TaxID=119000 RepID=A0A1G9M8M2_9GAMM|nr:hypothetical protein [Halomonas muralis]SDL70579.1 Transmembrane transcriptional regulator (anti-sigma factor RsiW) [Halomonas muralis]
MNTRHPTEYDLHAYLDDQLDAEQRQWVEAYLAANPQAATQLDGWRQDAQRLRATFANPQQWPSNSALDPARIRQRQRHRQHTRFATAAAMVMVLGTGLTSGWQAHDMMTADPVPPMQDALQAYRLFTDNTSTATTLDTNAAAGTARATPAEVSREQITQLFQTHFNDGVMPPDLSAAGLQIADARLLVTEQGPSAMVLYHDQHGRQMMMYIRPPGANHHRLEPGKRIDGQLLAQYWSRDDYNYAIVSQPNDPNAAILKSMLRNS